jgi:hypothetical protein
MANPKTPEIDQRLYTIMKGVYREYTGEQLAEVLKLIRKEITEAEEAARLKAELKRLKNLVKDQEDQPS